MNKIGNVMGEQFFCTKRTICGGIVRCVTESELAPVCGEASRPEVRVGKHEQVFDGRTTKQKRTSEPARIPHVSIPYGALRELGSAIFRNRFGRSNGTVTRRSFDTSADAKLAGVKLEAALCHIQVHTSR